MEYRGCTQLDRRQERIPVKLEWKRGKKFSSFQFAGLIHSASHKSQSPSRSNPIYLPTNRCCTSQND